MAVRNTLDYYLKSEPWRTGMKETVYWKALKQKLYCTRKSKNFKETVSFHLASNHSNY